MKKLKRISDANYLLNAIDLEEAILEKATQIAERLLLAATREKNRKEIKSDVFPNLDLDILASKIAEKIRIKAPSFSSVENIEDKFSFDDKDVQVLHSKTEEIKGLTIKKEYSKESTQKSLEALGDLEI